MESEANELAGYDRIAAGERIRNRRIIMGWTQEELSEKIGRTYKYCQDIERGSCGMSIDTMLGIAACLNISLDYLIYGYDEKATQFSNLDAEQQAVIDILGSCSLKKKKYALDLLKLFMKACDER